MDARSEDTALFYRLIHRQRGDPKSSMCELAVNDEKHCGTASIREGWTEHFHNLAIPAVDSRYDEKYYNCVTEDIDVIHDICEHEADPLQPTDEEEVTSSIKQLNTGKAPDIYGVTAEHILYAGNTIVYMLVDVMNAIFNLGQVPDILKHGTITPIFKKKGSKNEAKNYRGITVLPVIAKLLELLLRSRMRAVLDPQQNPMQQGFTQRSSPL